MRPALQQTVLEWTREWERIGREEGRRQGVMNFLVHQLEFKFGALQPGDRIRFETADTEQLIAWGEGLLTAESLHEVLGDLISP